MMIDAKTGENAQEAPRPAPPAYVGSQSGQSQPPPQGQWQWQGEQSAQRPAYPQELSASEIGQQYRSAQFAQCAMGNHARSTKYGMCGVITAVLLFPIGLICLLMDKEEVCTRCGNRL